MKSPSSNTEPQVLLAALTQPKARVLIVTHRDPDGDALGSSLALLGLLKARGVDATFVCTEPLPSYAVSWPGVQDIQSELGKDYTVLVTLDCSNFERVLIKAEIASLHIPLHINIDHHPDNPFFGQLNWVLPKVSSVGEILTSLFVGWNWALTPAAATCLYAAILFDTGRFLYQNVSPETYRLTARLMEFGADTALVCGGMYQNMSAASFELMKWILDRTEICSELGFAWCILPKEAPEGDLKAVDFIRQRTGIQVAAVFLELPDATYKANLRSKSDQFSVQSVAAQFGGGGHRQAAGMRLSSIQDVEAVIACLKDALRGKC